jgi:hypothetical protein
LAIVPSLLLLVGVYFQPESPGWLVQKGRETEAQAILRRSCNIERADAEIEDIKRVDRQEEGQIGLRTLLSSPYCGAYC